MYINNSIYQVLSDGSNTYLYGVARIAEPNIVGWHYYFGDALGRVHQLANTIGMINRSRNCEPFGKRLLFAGNQLTKYSFTGE